MPKDASQTEPQPGRNTRDKSSHKFTGEDSSPDFYDRVQVITERILTYRARVRRIKKEKRKAKNPIVDWIEAFLWAACMVLLINQYLVQAYRIPSGSMIDTLNIGDHVFVNKIIYGPELLPGFLKLPSLFIPKRNDIIIFESPAYISRGTVFDIAQRIIYMLTLSLVDIDRDEKGEQRIHFLIKRAAGQAGDRFKIENGEMKIRFAGEDRWVDEREYNASRGWDHNIRRLVSPDQYPALSAAGQARGWSDLGFPVSDELYSRALPVENMQYGDSFAYHRARLQTQRKAAVQDRRYAMLHAREHTLGFYIPEGRILPLGDNRDSSHDGRNFGPVRLSKVLGMGMIIYWPYKRMGKIE
ncbi:MAG: signal peptidase I [Treponema sp.]|jgi:signal peptidase I|nr:signal peptidase I [Treponema sp.]